MALTVTAAAARHKLKGQPGARRFQVWTDDHGRQWGSEIEIKTGDPTGVINPIDWTPPDPRLLPDQKYLHPLIDGAGRPVAGRLTIDYEGWIDDLARLHQERKDQLLSWAAKMYGDKAAGVIESPSAELLIMLGIAPPAIEPVYAMQQGDKWALGIKIRRPQGAGKFKMVDPPRPEWATDKILPPLRGSRNGARVVHLDPEFLAAFEAVKSQKDDETDADREARAAAAAGR